MTSFVYTNNIPYVDDDPSVDQPNMLINTNSTSGIIAVDHVGFNASNGGYHTVIHQQNAPSNTDPAAITSTGQTYIKTITPTGGLPDTQLFFRSAAGIITQLTGGTAPSGATNGYVYLPGGIILQWGANTAVSSGSFASGAASGQVVFSAANIAFPNACFMVNTVPFYNGAAAPNGAGSVNIVQSGAGALDSSAFNWTFNSNSGKYTGFYWLAVGN